MNRSVRWNRALLAGAVGGVAFIATMFLFFGPAQSILQDPHFQSEKVLKVFFEIPPAPRMSTQPGPVLAGFFLFGILHGLVFAVLAPALPGQGWRQGLSFGLLLWLLMILWFEFFMLWNVLHEPPLLILLELGLWLMVNLSEGVVIALVYRYRVV